MGMGLGAEPSWMWRSYEQERAECAESFWEGVGLAVDAINCLAPGKLQAQEGPLRPAKKKGGCPTLELQLKFTLPVDPAGDWDAREFLLEVQQLLEEAAQQLQPW